MARKSCIVKQQRRERLVEHKKERRAELKARIKDPKLADEERELARDQLNQLSRNSSAVRLRNRCALTGRSRGYLRKFGLSRICFRELSSKGMIPGITKASW